VRVILADDAVLFREGVARILIEAGIEVVGQVGDGDALVEAAAAARPDAVVVDIRMPPTYTTEGLAAAARVRQAQPEVAVLVLSQYVEAQHAADLLGDRRGGVGYLLKERVADLAVLTDTLGRLCRRESVLDPEVVAVVLGRGRRRDVLHRLTGREREVLSLMAEGRSNSAIGALLHLSPKTVETHVRNVFMKLDLEPTDDVNRRVLAVLTHLRHGVT
jgi:DNA-binding NarL/FixJ family response regulator